MSTAAALTECSTERVLLGDEAVALAAIHAGIHAAYAYPGTPSTEILEFIAGHARREGRPRATWAANEKTAYEEALGVSMAGRRVLVSMKHVGLNVAADPFMSSGIVRISGGLVLAVADDPGMHSSQNEQDSRYYADFAHVPCLEPADQQEAYDMTRQAFDLSEHFRVPVLIRLVTRLAHGRARVVARPPTAEPEPPPERRWGDWILLPAFARKLWHERLVQHAGVAEALERSPFNALQLADGRRELGVITCGIGRNYFRENAGELEVEPAHLHVGAYPIPAAKIRALAGNVDHLLVIEEGYPFVERLVRGVLPASIPVYGKASGHLPPDGELTPETVRWALGLPEHETRATSTIPVPPRPPRLCSGCPHCDAFTALNRVLAEHEHDLVTSDIGCYTLGMLPPHSIGESCVCMGASVSMAKGAADAGAWPVVAVIGDSTFVHSGIPPLADAVAADSDMTVVILDNEVVAMTGTQPTLLGAERIRQLILGLGVDPKHCHLFETHPKKIDELTALLRREVEHHGLSVVIAARECLEAARRRKREARKEGA